MDTVVPRTRPAELRLARPVEDPVADVAARAARLADELAALRARLEATGGLDPWVRQARYRLADAADSCRRAAEELDDIARVAADRSAGAGQTCGPRAARPSTIAAGGRSGRPDPA